jgi:hypothetical protein
MAILNNSNAISSGSYDINNSLRFRASASAYLNRTPSVASNRKTWTWSAWVKRGLAGEQFLFSATSNGTTTTWFRFTGSNTIDYVEFSGSTFPVNIATNAVYRDFSSWYHVVIAFDSTQATEANRLKIYINGNQQTLTGTYPSLNLDSYINGNWTHTICKEARGAYYGEQYLTDVNFIDGQALTPSSFGETDTTTGSWKPKAYTGTYGTNGFYLKFSDIATTSGSNAGLGKDFSGNANYWTTNNISVTAGSTYDAMIDSPTLTSATVGNYATLNPLDNLSTSTPTFANLRTTYSSTIASRKSTIVMASGKWYTEWNITGSGGGGGDLIIQTVGIISPTATSNSPAVSGVGYYGYGNGTNSQKIVNGTATTYGTYWGNAGTYTLGAALDITGGTITFYLNGVSQGAITLPSNTDGWVFVNYNGTGTGTCTVDNNFGQRPFTYTPPTGFVRLNTYNLPDSTIKKGNTVMDANIWTGNGTGITITNSGAMKPDLMWIKSRSVAGYYHVLTDSVRGITKALYSNATDSENTLSTRITAINSNGFSLGTSGDVNDNAQTFVGWQWQAGQGSTSSNTSGSITSTVSANTTAGFSVVTYTGTGANATVGHGLGVAPAMVIVKRRSGAEAWGVYHKSLGATQAINLELTVAAYTYAIAWNNTAPTSSTFSLGTWAAVNSSGGTFVAYCWAEIAGFSKFGSYTGNGSSDGPFTYTGFRPKFIMVKRTDSTGPWLIYDTARDIYNQSNTLLRANTSQAETASGEIDILSNGFKYRGSSTNADYVTNVSGATYIYMAFAENPFKNSLAR